MRLGERVVRIEEADTLDRVSVPMQRAAERIPEGKVRDTLHGVQLGHPAHPLLAQLPIGTWTAAVLLDALPGTGRSAHWLVNIGLATAVPTALTGLADWSRQHERQRRVGVVHAASNSLGTLLFGASSLARARHRGTLGKVLAAVGLCAVGVGGYLGAHIAYYRAGGANRADYLIDQMPRDWQEIGSLDAFEEGRPTLVGLGPVPVVAVRTGDSVRALVATCTHMGGPLSEGDLEGDCIRCPWHGSLFHLVDGSVARGPATAAQEALEVSVQDGAVLARPRGTV